MLLLLVGGGGDVGAEVVFFKLLKKHRKAAGGEGGVARKPRHVLLPAVHFAYILRYCTYTINTAEGQYVVYHQAMLYLL